MQGLAITMKRMFSTAISAVIKISDGKIATVAFLSCPEGDYVTYAFQGEGGGAAAGLTL